MRHIFNLRNITTGNIVLTSSSIQRVNGFLIGLMVANNGNYTVTCEQKHTPPTWKKTIVREYKDGKCHYIEYNNKGEKTSEHDTLGNGLSRLNAVIDYRSLYENDMTWTIAGNSYQIEEMEIL